MKAALIFACALAVVPMVAPPESCAPCTMVRDSAGPILTMTNGELPAYTEYAREGFTEKGSVGALGAFEMNLSYNMDYADNVHRFYNSGKNAYWMALGNTGMTLQYAPAGGCSADIWTNCGNDVFFASVDKLAVSGDMGVLSGKRLYLDGTRSSPLDNPEFHDTYISEIASDTIGFVTPKASSPWNAWVFNSTASTGGAIAVQRSGNDLVYLGDARSVSSAYGNDDAILHGVNRLIVSGPSLDVVASSVKINGTTTATGSTCTSFVHGLCVSASSDDPQVALLKAEIAALSARIAALESQVRK